MSVIKTRQNQNHQFLVKNARNSLSLKLFTGIHCLPTFTQAAAQLRGRCGFETDARSPGASGSETSQNQPTTPQFLTKLLGKTGDQQVSAGLIYRPKPVQGTPTPLTLQPKMHAAAAGILTEKFSPDKPSLEPPSPRAPELNHVA